MSRFHPEARPDIVVWPRSVDEAAAVVAVAAAHRLPIVPFGAGTSLEGHVAALAGGLSVDMRELDAIGRPSIEDLDVVVQAGVTRRALDARLRPEGVFFSVDPGADATIGGMIATGASGTTTVRYGAMRENVLSITFVNGRGEVVRTHSRARKSSAGYDLTRLMIGSEGTLGLICEATLRLHPTPEAIAAAQCTFPSVGAAVECVVMVSQHAIPVARIELADELTIESINRHNQTAFTVAPTLFIEFHGGSRSEVETQARDTAQIAADCGGSGFAWASDESERRRLWHARHGAMEAARAMRPGSGALTTDVCVPVSALADCIAATQADIAQHGLTASIVGHVGDGNFHVVVLVDPDDPAEVARGEAFHAAPRAPCPRARRHVHRGAWRRLRQGALPGGGARPPGGRDDARDQAGPRSRRDLQPGQDRRRRAALVPEAPEDATRAPGPRIRRRSPRARARRAAGTTGRCG